MATPLVPHTKVRGGKLYLNLPIPAELRRHYLTAKGKPRTHIVEALGTGDPNEARELARIRSGELAREFRKLRKGRKGELPSDLRKATALRASMAQAREKGDEDEAFVVETLARDHADRVGGDAGAEAAEGFYELATQPEKLTLLQTVERMNESPDITEGTKKKREQVLAELLKFMKVEDCLPQRVTEAKAVAYVDWLNATDLGYSTKQDRLSTFQTIWRFLAMKRQVPKGQNPWTEHELTGRKRATATDEGAKRGWKDAELAKLFAAPDESRAVHYSRRLFRELYTLGLTTGMRLDEIVSIRPGVVEVVRGAYWIAIESSKTDAGVRTIPVVHKAAAAILKRRLAAQKNPAKSIFPECRPGGPDNKLSWHVQKAMGRDRDRLGFGPEVDFHSTRRTFLTIMDNAGADVVHVQRYVGHKVPSMMHSVYSDGSNRANLLKVARAVKYPAKVEAALSV
jgi:integrase